MILIYAKYGEIFKKLRKQRYIPLSVFEEIGISKATITNFERGKSMISLDRFISALSRMGVTLSEFEIYINNFDNDSLDDLLEEIEWRWIIQDNETLSRIEQERIINGDLIIALVVKWKLTTLNEEEKEQIVAYLYSLKYWTYIDIMIFYLSIDFISTKDIVYLIDSYLNLAKGQLHIRKYKNKVSMLIYNAAAVTISRNQQSISYYLINLIDFSMYRETMFEANVKTLILGFYQYTFSNKEEGMKTISRSLEIIKNLSGIKLYNHYIRICETYISDFSK
jgi:Rgg/GadR/MutR family transcriptional activator